MPRISRHGAAVGVFGLTLIFIVLFWRLGTPTFWDPDEAHYAETTREMIATADWWAPYYNEQPFFDKPVLFHQLQAVAMQLFSDPEFAARIVPALAALALIGITIWFGQAMVSREAGLVAGLILGANPGVFALSRYAILDMLFTLFVFGGCACLAVAALRERRSLQWLGYVAIALGVVVKGPLALVLCGLTFLMLTAVSAELRHRLLALRWLAGLVIIIALAAPWFVYMYLRFHQGFMNGYVLDENVRLFAASRFANQPGYGFYFQILAAGMLPWTGMLIGRLIDDVRAAWRGTGIDAVETMLWAWSAAIVGFFTFSTFKLDHYVFPATPALCLLCARAWAGSAGRVPAEGAGEGAATRVGLLLVGPFLAIVGAALAYLLLTRLALPGGALIVPAALIVCGLAFAVSVNAHGGTPPTVPWLVLAPIAVTYAGLILFALPALEQRKVIPDVAAWVAARAQPADRVASYHLNRWNPAYRFYVGRHTTFLEDAASANEFFQRPEPFYVVMRRDGYDELVAQGAPLRILYEREGMSVTSGRALWRTPEPLVRYVVATKR